MIFGIRPIERENVINLFLPAREQKCRSSGQEVRRAGALNAWPIVKPCDGGHDCRAVHTETRTKGVPQLTQSRECHVRIQAEVSVAEHLRGLQHI